MGFGWGLVPVPSHVSCPLLGQHSLGEGLQVQPFSHSPQGLCAGCPHASPATAAAAEGGGEGCEVHLGTLGEWRRGGGHHLPSCVCDGSVAPPLKNKCSCQLPDGLCSLIPEDSAHWTELCLPAVSVWEHVSLRDASHQGFYPPSLGNPVPAMTAVPASLT